MLYYFPHTPNLDECRAAIAACTDEQSTADPMGDGDQSFVRAAMESDKGMRLKRARNSGMDYSLCNLSTFARACATGDLATVEEALALVVQYGTDPDLIEEVRRFRALSSSKNNANATNVRSLRGGKQLAKNPKGCLETAVMASQARNGRLGQP